MKNFHIQIRYNGYYANFSVIAEDSVESIEQSILDKIGEKSITWEYLGNNYSDEINRITFEEVINDTRPIQTKKVLGVEVGTGASI